MAIDYRMAKVILQEHKYRPLEGTILLIGRQTVTLTSEQARSLVESEGVQIRPDALDEIDTKTFGAEGRHLITDRAFFSLFSTARMISLDVSDYEGASIIADINHPISENYHNVADFIFNGSCMDNLFDSASALKNMTCLLKARGRIIHIEHGSPIQSAYIMYSPAYFFDYYAANNFLDCKIYSMMFCSVLEPWNVFQWQAYHYQDGQLRMTPAMMHSGWPNILNVVIAEKGLDSTPDSTPIQGFYRQVHHTELDIYMNAYRRFSESKRPMLKLTEAIDATGSSDVGGFVPIGVLEDPQMTSHLKALDEIYAAREFRAKGDQKEAIAAFSRAIDLNDKVGQPGLIYIERGDLYLSCGQYKEAVADFKKAVTMNNDPSFSVRLANAVRIQDSPTQALLSKTPHRAASLLWKILNKISL